MLIFAEGVRLSLRGVSIANNGYVNVDDVGEGDDALLCHTDKSDCCDYYRVGEWYYPSGNIVRTMGGSGDEFYRNRGPQVVRLNRRQGTFTERGLFQCEVPDASYIYHSVYVNIGITLL